MANSLLVQLLVLFFAFSGRAAIDRSLSEGYLGEKRLDSYSGRYEPLIFQDIYQGKMSFADDVFFQNFFSPYLMSEEGDLTFFLKSELGAGESCPNALLSHHFDDIRFAYRLITLSYLLEGQWELEKKGCQFDLSQWLKKCDPKSESMKGFVEKMKKYPPQLDGALHLFADQRLSTGRPLSRSCEEGENLMRLICSEEDELYGLSTHREAYTLLGLSHLVGSFKSQGEAMGCLRRFSEVMSHKEVRYKELDQLFPLIETELRQKYQERFLQGRAFLYGPSQGLPNLFIKKQGFEVASLPIEVDTQETTAVVKKEVPQIKTPEKSKPLPVALPAKPEKSAFLQAAEIRANQNLAKVEVDLEKLKYDYVFSLKMINTLSQRLKAFMQREALQEMRDLDKLGSKESPVPILFIKYMIDMQEHQGLFNLTQILGEKFYVSNEIDESYRPRPELIRLTQDNAEKNWQIFILRP